MCRICVWLLKSICIKSHWSCHKAQKITMWTVNISFKWSAREPSVGMEILCPKMQPIGRLSITETIVSVINKKFQSAVSTLHSHQQIMKKMLQSKFLLSKTLNALFYHLILKVIYLTIFFFKWFILSWHFCLTECISGNLAAWISQGNRHGTVSFKVIIIIIIIIAVITIWWLPWGLRQHREAHHIV